MSVLNAIYTNPFSMLHFDFFTYHHVQTQLSLRLLSPKGKHNFKVQVMNIMVDIMILSSVWHYSQGHFFTS